MRSILDEDEVTLETLNCQSWMELKAHIKKYAPFISTSRATDIEHSQEDLLRKIELVRKGQFPNIITRANGLRAKVCELVLCKNYDNPWE